MKIKIAAYIVLSLLLSLLVVLVFLTLNGLRAFNIIKVSKYPTSGPSEIALSNAISRYKNGEIPVVDLSTVTTFSWDRAYIFGPYTEGSEIDAVVGKSWRDSCFTTIAGSDGLTLLLFTRDEQAVGCIEFPRDQADFESLESYESGFSVQEARFIMDERGNMVWVDGK